MQKLFLVETPHQFKLTITADHNITSTGENCMCRICTINAESRNPSKCKCMYNVTLFPTAPQKRKQKRTIMHNRQCSRWCMVETHISEQSISFEDTITTMFNSLWTTLKKCAIILPIRPSVRQSLYYIFPSTIIPEIKFMQFYLAFEQREHLISSARKNPLLALV